MAPVKNHHTFWKSGKYLFSLLTLFLPGCETTYQRPSEGKLAQLRVAVSQYSGTANFRAVYYRNNRCDQAEVLGIGSLLGHTQSDPTSTIPRTGDIGEITYFDKYVDATDHINIRITSFAPHYSCSVPVSFSTEEGHMYELEFSWVGRCHVAVYEYGGSEQAPVKIPVQIAKPEPECKTGFKGPVSP